MLFPHLPHLLQADYFSFYLAGFGVATLALLYEGHRWRYSWRPWLLLVAGTLLMFMLGAKGIGEFWPSHPTLGQLSAEARAILGGLAGGGLGLAAMRRLLGFDRRAADAFALPFALGIGVQGLENVVAFTGLPPAQASIWHYLSALPAWMMQATRLLAATDVLLAHAVQAGLCALIVVGLLLVRYRRFGLLVPGNAWLLAVALFAAGRFGVEFLRDPAAAEATRWLGLKPVQWALLTAALTLVVSAAWRYHLWTTSFRPYSFPTDRPLPNMALLVGLAALTVVPGAAWAQPEVLLIRGLLLPVLLLEGWRQACVRGLVKPLPF